MVMLVRDMNIPDNSGFTLLNYAAILDIQNCGALIASGVLMYNKNQKIKSCTIFQRKKKIRKN